MAGECKIVKKAIEQNRQEANKLRDEAEALKCITYTPEQYSSVSCFNEKQRKFKAADDYDATALALETQFKQLCEGVKAK